MYDLRYVLIKRTLGNVKQKEIGEREKKSVVTASAVFSDKMFRSRAHMNMYVSHLNMQWAERKAWRLFFFFVRSSFHSSVLDMIRYLFVRECDLTDLNACGRYYQENQNIVSNLLQCTHSMFIKHPHQKVYSVLIYSFWRRTRKNLA